MTNIPTQFVSLLPVEDVQREINVFRLEGGQVKVVEFNIFWTKGLPYSTGSWTMEIEDVSGQVE